MRSYGDDWVGDNSDIRSPDPVHVFTDIDMTAWAAIFLDAVDGLFAPDMRAAIVALDPDRAASLAGHKQQLADILASTLLPVLVVPGQVPAMQEARALFRQALLDRLGTAYAPDGDGAPLPFGPRPPSIRAMGAVTAPAPVSIAAALLWDCVVTIETSQAAQDEMLLSLIMNDPSPADPATGPAIGAIMPRTAAATTLFDALARTIVEWPQIAPQFAAALAGGSATVARAALERLDALIGDVVSTWPDWVAQALPLDGADAGAASTAGRAIWSYAVDFRTLPDLRVTRLPGDDGMPPPWPAITGFIAPAGPGQACDSYRASADHPADAPLTFTWAMPAMVQARKVDVAAQARRNANLVPPDSPGGTLVDPAFIHTTQLAKGLVPLVPLADLPSHPFRIGAGAATLSEAMGDLFASLLPEPVPTGPALRDIHIDIEASWRVSLGIGDSQADVGVPICLADAVLALSPDVSEGSVPVDAFRRKVTDALLDWHAATPPQDDPAVLRFAVTLALPGEERRIPLVRLGQLDVAVPVAPTDWWR